MKTKKPQRRNRERKILGDRQEVTTAEKLSFYCTWEFVSHIKDETQIMGTNAICNQEIYNTNNVYTLNYVSGPTFFFFFQPYLKSQGFLVRIMPMTLNQAALVLYTNLLLYRSISWILRNNLCWGS